MAQFERINAFISLVFLCVCIPFFAWACFNFHGNGKETLSFSLAEIWKDYYGSDHCCSPFRYNSFGRKRGKCSPNDNRGCIISHFCSFMKSERTNLSKPQEMLGLEHHPRLDGQRRITPTHTRTTDTWENDGEQVNAMQCNQNERNSLSIVLAGHRFLKLMRSVLCCNFLSDESFRK